MRKKKCKACREVFQPERPMQEACSVKCALDLARVKEEKKARRRETERKRKDRARLEELRPLRHWIAKTQQVFNEYIRLRDEKESCISCQATPGEVKYGGAWDCGHYRSIGSATHLRFDERNAHKQCVRCNRDLSGNTVDYRAGLIEKIGREAVEQLESEYYVKKWTKEELAELRAEYKRKINELKRAAA